MKALHPRVDVASIERMSKRNDPCEGVVSLGGEALVSMVSRRLDAPGLNVGGPFSLLQALVADWQQSGLSALRYYAFQVSIAWMGGSLPAIKCQIAPYTS